MNKGHIMFQGTASSVGKSLLTTGLCRILYEDGYNVAPFKSQNMSLNAYITNEGKEMGIAQAVQAEAAGVEPSVLMNPILIKPTGSMQAQYVIQGEVYQDMDAVTYHKFKPQLKQMLQHTYHALWEKHEVIVLEGAGSPAEINLRENDIVNMGMAELVDAPVILIGDIDRGGVFASIVGTLQLLSEEERNRVKGVIINKFRGDIQLLTPGVKMLEDIIHKPVLGVVPYMPIRIEDEDSTSLEQRKNKKHIANTIKVGIIRLPHMSNFTDFNPLETLAFVDVNYVGRIDELEACDMIILPGTKATIEDLRYLKHMKLDQAIISRHQKGIPIIGICGGLQMLGKAIHNPHGLETTTKSIEGLGLLDVETTFETEKITTRVKGHIIYEKGMLGACEGAEVDGYEIHMGKTYGVGPNCIPCLKITETLGKPDERVEGYCSIDGLVFGSYMHGLFDSFDFTNKLLSYYRDKKGCENLEYAKYTEVKEQSYKQLANTLRDTLNLDKIREIIFNNGGL